MSIGLLKIKNIKEFCMKIEFNAVMLKFMLELQMIDYK